MSYLDIPIDNNPHFCFDLLDQNDNIVEPQFPISIGYNYGYNYNLGCRIKINDILSEYNLCFDDLTDATLYLFGTNYVGDMNVFYSNSGEISDSPITPNYLSYVIPLGETYNTDYSGYVFKMSTPNADTLRTNSVFSNMGSYIRIEYNALESIYISNVPKRRYFNTEHLNLNDLEIKAVLSDNTEEIITNYTPSIPNGSVLSPSNTSVTFSYTRNLRTRTCTLLIEVFPWGELNTNYINNGTNPQQTFDIYGPSGNNQTFPVVVTIHGGGYRDGVDKSAYNYITSFLLGNNCVHVNMNYRLIPSSPSDKPYFIDMLQDIDSMIKYLNEHRKTIDNPSGYPIDLSNIYLMGYSAGGHLALLYSFFDFFRYNIPNFTLSHKDYINKVISVAGPTCFISSSIPSDLIDTINYLAKGSNDASQDDLDRISPYSHVVVNSTITKNVFLAYSKSDSLVTIDQGCKFFRLSTNEITCNNNCNQCNIVSNSSNDMFFEVINSLSHDDMGHLSDFNDTNHLDVQAYYTSLSNFLNNNS